MQKKYEPNLFQRGAPEFEHIECQQMGPAAGGAGDALAPEVADGPGIAAGEDDIIPS